MTPSPTDPRPARRPATWWSRRLKQVLHLKAGTIAALLAVAVFLSIAPILILQQQKLQANITSAQNKVDSVLWLVYQTERAHARMRMSWRDALDSPTPQALQALSLRYEILVSRYELIKDSPTLERFRLVDEYKNVYSRLQKFIETADPVMVGLTERPINFAALKSLIVQANNDEEALRDLSNYATNVVYTEINQRNTTIEGQGLWILGLVTLQLVLLSGALVGLILFARRQRRHNLQLLKLTRNLRTARSKALNANKAKSVFLANMSHELRTPFQGLLGMLSLLSETHLSSTQHDYTHTALKSARHLLGILNDILDVSTVETGLLRLRTGAVHLPGLVGEVQDLMVAAAHEKNLSLTVQLDPELPQWIEADATRLSQILFNLLSNSIKFTDAGSVAVRCAWLPATSHNPTEGLRIEVRDTGIGMDSATLAGLFSRFYQGDLSIHRRYGGTGLGLEISRTLAQLMGGTIDVASTLGQGSVFTVVLPLHRAQAPASTTPLPVANLNSLQILIADDHPINVKYLRILLEKMGHAVTTCENGAAALAQVRQQRFDVVLMDLHMPEMDGVTATRAIRQLEGVAGQTPVVMVSADILNNTRQSAIDAGANEFIAKPLLIDGLRQVLARCTAPSPLAPPQDGAAALKATPSLQWVNPEVFHGFVDLMPAATVNKQLGALFNQQPSEVDCIATAMAAGQAADAVQLAHKLKGACMLMGFSALARTLARLEASQNSPTDTALLLDQLRRDVQQTRLALAPLHSLPLAVA
jgi:two-component system, sensor histidine kinase